MCIDNCIPLCYLILSVVKKTILVDILIPQFSKNKLFEINTSNKNIKNKKELKIE